MRYATIVLWGEDGRIAPLLDRFDRSAHVAIEATRYLGPITDGHYIGLFDLCGSLPVAEETLAASDEVLRYDVTGTDDRGVAYVQCRTVGLIGDLLSILYAHDIVLDWPIEHRRTRGKRAARLTVIGTSTGIQQAVSELPGEIEFELEQIGRFDPNSGESRTLTVRQAALLDFAVREGYYEVPRRTTHSALACELDLSVGTVSDRLQRIENRIVAAYTDR